MAISRIDPLGCGCTDCLIGDYSVPLNEAKAEDVKRMLQGEAQDATNHAFELKTQVISVYDSSLRWSWTTTERHEARLRETAVGEERHAA